MDICEHHGGATEIGDGGVPPDLVLGHLEGVGEGGGRFETHAPYGFSVAADDYRGPGVLEGVGAPVPHVKRVDPVVGIAGPVEVPVPLVGGKAFLVDLFYLEG